jgi:hypothetical protein
MTRRLCSALALLVLAFVCPLEGCAGTETGNPKPPQLELRLTAYSSDFGRVSVGKAGGGLEVEHAFVTLERVELLPCSGDASGVEISVGELDLAQRPPSVLLADSDETDFCAARVLLAHGAGEVAPELAGRSALLHGVRADGVSFQIASELELTVDLTASPPTTPFGSRRLLLGFDLAKWLNGVGVETAAAENGAVTIDSTLAPDALAVFDAQAASAVALFDDADGNGQRASDNQPPAASAGP